VLSNDSSVRVYDISRNKADCLVTLRHDVYVGSLSLSPDNSILAVGGQNKDIFIWSLKEEKLLRTFNNPNPNQAELEENGTPQNSRAVFDISWSSDGTLISCGCDKDLIMLDMRKILS